MNFFESINEMTVAQALLAYLQRGKSVFPVRPLTVGKHLKAKAPLVPWKVYQTTCATPYEANRWIDLYPDMGLGFPTGAQNGFNVLDADSDEAERWLREHAPATSLCQRTRKGLHRFYRCGSLKVPTLTGIGPVLGIDSRGEGGFVVIAPSVIDGHRYQWVWDDTELVRHQTVPTLDVMGADFFKQPKMSTRRHDQHAHADHLSFAPVYDDVTGLIVDHRESFLRDTTMAVAAAAVRETDCLPSVEFVAQYAWELFCQRVDMSDGKWTFEHCVQKAEYVVRRIADGTIDIGEFDGEIGDVHGYVEHCR